jgi:branched-chain amino acid transport system ATP-binding protein
VPVALQVTDLTISFGGVVAVNGMSLSIVPGQIVGLIGPNGAGKTTFINCVAGAYRPSRGTVQWKGTELRGLAPHAVIRQGVARTFQNVASLHDLTVLDIVKLGAGAGAARRRGLSAAAALWRGEKALEEELHEEVLGPLRLGDLAGQPIQTLSYGLRKAVDLARALASRPELLLLDEPVAGLTAHEGQQMAAVIREVRDRRQCAVLMVEHKMDVVMSTCDRITVMAAGARIFEGTGAEVQADPEVRRVYLGEP